MLYNIAVEKKGDKKYMSVRRKKSKADKTDEDIMNAETSAEPQPSKSDGPVISDLKGYDESDMSDPFAGGSADGNEEFYRAVDEATQDSEHAYAIIDDPESEESRFKAKEEQFKKLYKFLTSEDPDYFVSDVADDDDTVTVKASGICQSLEDQLVSPKTGGNESLMYITLKISKKTGVIEKILVSFRFYFPEDRSDYVFDDGMSEEESHAIIDAMYKTLRSDVQKRSTMLLTLQTML